MSRLSVLVVLVVSAFAGALWADTFDISTVMAPTFSDVALLPTRLTLYNQHDDAATASYTCCRPDQEVEILKAIKANEDFANNHPHSDFAPAAAMHYAWVNEVRRNFRAQVQAYKLVVDQYPDYSNADSAAWRLAALYAEDKDHKNAVQTLQYLVKQWPESTHAPAALLTLFNEYKELNDRPSAISVLEQLVDSYPKAEECPEALNALGQKYMEAESYDRAIRVSQMLLDRYPWSPYADEAQMRTGEALWHKGEIRKAVNAYEWLIHHMYGSSRTNQAMRMVNTLNQQILGSGNLSRGHVYDTQAVDPGRDAQDLWDMAMHHQNYREYADAISAYRKFTHNFPGNDKYAQAVFNIGVCYEQMDMLFQEVNKAKGPDDLFRLQDSWKDATGRSEIDSGGGLSAVNDATSAFAVVVNKFVGSPLRDDALMEIARAYTPYGEIDKTPKPDAAFTYQELIINFPGCACESVALARLMRFYADTSTWDTAQKMYPALAKTLPNVFPKGLEQNKTQFYELMKLYARRTDFCYFETVTHHIKYALSPANLLPDARLYQGGMLMETGDYTLAAKVLRPLCSMPTSENCAQALYLMSQCRERLGDKAGANECYEVLADDYHHEDGLKDDAELCAKGVPDCSEYAAQVKAKFGVDAQNMDAYVGDNVVVFAPFTVAAKMREYNIPNIWDRSVKILREWTGSKDTAKTVVLVDPADRTSAGNPMMVPASQINDPPNWALGLRELSLNAAVSAVGPRFANNPAILGGLADFGAASLQYELVTETRDAIGSAEAVKLPQEAVISARQAALKSLEDYVRATDTGNVNTQVVSGMMYALLDAKGFSKDRLIDREPYRKFFAALRAMPDGNGGIEAFACALNHCFGDTCGEQFKQWRLPVATQSASAAG